MKRNLAKRAAALLLAAALLTPIKAAQAAGASERQQIIAALGIVTGDASGNLNLSGQVTRAEYAKMLVTASEYKDSVSPMSNSSPFSDVPYTHWAAGYIKTAVKNGWLSGYIDGTYKPANPVTLEEAATGVLKLLGYSSSDFTGSFPYGQLSLAQSLGLFENIGLSQGQPMTREACITLFYNALGAKSKGENQYYAQKLGYTVDNDGNIDYNSVITDSLKGPVISEGPIEKSGIPLDYTKATIYRNGVKAAADEIRQYDVLYYSVTMQTIWSYANRVTGTLEKVDNLDAPGQAVVSGVTYEISGTPAKLALSSVGSLSIGDSITLLLGRDGKAVGALPAAELSQNLYGVALSSGVSSYTDISGVSYNANYVKLLATDGQTYTVRTPAKSYTAGRILAVTYENGEQKVEEMKQTGAGGKVDAAARKIGEQSAARDIRILDVYDNTGTPVYLSRLDGLTLSGATVYASVTNDRGEISELILRDATGDCLEYGVIVGSQKKETSDATSYTVSYNCKGAVKQAEIGKRLNESGIPAVKVTTKNGSIDEVTALTKTGEITGVDGWTLQTEDGGYTVWEQASVFIYSNQTTDYHVSSLSQVSDLDTYYLKAYYDRPMELGGRVRVVIATEKTW